MALKPLSKPFHPLHWSIYFKCQYQNHRQRNNDNCNNGAANYIACFNCEALSFPRYRFNYFFEWLAEHRKKSVKYLKVGITRIYRIMSSGFQKFNKFSWKFLFFTVSSIFYFFFLVCELASITISDPLGDRCLFTSVALLHFLPICCSHSLEFSSVILDRRTG